MKVIVELEILDKENIVKNKLIMLRIKHGCPVSSSG